MLRKYYHYFISGLYEVFLDDSDVNFPMQEFKHELVDHLHPDDYKLVELLFLPYDNQNLLLFLKDDYENFNDLGKFSVQDFEQETSDERLNILPFYMYQFIELYRNEELSKDVNQSWENVLTEMYYSFVLKTKNQFLKQWFEFNMNLNNILTGYNCKKHNLEPEKELIGDNMVTDAIKNSNAKDFGLGTELEYVSDIISLAEKEDLLSREKGLDQLRWETIEELTLFDYFTIEVILAYTIKLDLTYRWLELDEEVGREMFSKIINDLKSSFEFPKEFELNRKTK